MKQLQNKIRNISEYLYDLETFSEIKNHGISYRQMRDILWDFNISIKKSDLIRYDGNGMFLTIKDIKNRSYTNMIGQKKDNLGEVVTVISASFNDHEDNNFTIDGSARRSKKDPFDVKLGIRIARKNMMINLLYYLKDLYIEQIKNKRNTSCNLCRCSYSCS